MSSDTRTDADVLDTPTGYVNPREMAVKCELYRRLTESRAEVALLKASDNTINLMERCVREGLTVKFTYPHNADTMHQWGVSGRDIWATGRDLPEAYVRYVHERQYRGEGVE